jgi:hypothetical protein
MSILNLNTESELAFLTGNEVLPVTVALVVIQLDVAWCFRQPRRRWPTMVDLVLGIELRYTTISFHPVPLEVTIRAAVRTSPKYLLSSQEPSLHCPATAKPRVLPAATLSVLTGNRGSVALGPHITDSPE